MADKKVIAVFSNTISFAEDSKFGKKAAIFPNANMDGLEAILDTVGKKVDSTDAAIAEIEANTACVYTTDCEIDKILEAIDRRTTVVAITDKGVGFYGFGINTKVGQIARSINAQDVYVSLAYVADLPVNTDCTGGILYQMLKDPNLKVAEIAKLKEALLRMESVISRDNREPWEKHDCA